MNRKGVEKRMREYTIISVTANCYGISIREMDASTLEEIKMNGIIEISHQEIRLINEYAQKHKETLEKVEKQYRSMLIKTILQMEKL